jgi:uncharacterized iron-regulated membrane protein
MTAVTYSDGTGGEPRRVSIDASGADRASRQWRSVWRIHFYAGIFAMPFILLMALTGLVILYTQPIHDLTQGNIRTVSAQNATVSADLQEQAVEAAYPDVAVISMTTPADREHTTVFGVDDGSAAGMQVFVNPYTGRVLGSDKPGSGIVGLSNRLHGLLNNDTIKVSLPTVAALWDHGPVMRDYLVGDLILEILGVWTLVLICSGLYLWWPRRSRWKGAERSGGRKTLGLRFAKKGRARWRDVHAMSGVLLFGALLVTIFSGMAWSTYWGPNFTALANEISPNTWTDAPASTVGARGDLDRLGNQIHWNTGDIPIPASYATETDGSHPAAISLDSITKIGEQEGMLPGYTVYFPANSTDEAGNAVYGSFTLSNSWPRATGEAKDVFVDQFSGDTLAHQTAYGYGSVSYGLDVMVSTHMGTQLGIFSRIMMTAMCILAICSVISAGTMFWKRRRPGTAGLPRRPVDVRLAKRLAMFLCVFAVAFPTWAVTALVVLAFDRFVIRKVRPLRVAFGQR